MYVKETLDDLQFISAGAGPNFIQFLRKKAVSYTKMISSNQEEISKESVSPKASQELSYKKNL